jgi:hypothetical protein
MEPHQKPTNPPKDQSLPRLEIAQKIATTRPKTNFWENLKKRQKKGKIDSWANCPHERENK